MRGRDALREHARGPSTGRGPSCRRSTATGPLGDEALEKKRTGLQADPQHPSRDRAVRARRGGAAVGAWARTARKRYLVAVMNPAEMRASGGAPLSMALVVFKNGKLTIPMKGTTSSITSGSPEGLLGDSPELVWKRVKGDPFQPPLGEPQRFVNTGFNPDFRVSGEQMMRATPKFFGMQDRRRHRARRGGAGQAARGDRADRVRVRRPDLGEPGRGAAGQGLRGAGHRHPGRQQRNDQLMSVMLSNLMAGGGCRPRRRRSWRRAPARTSRCTSGTTGCSSWCATAAWTGGADARESGT